MFNKLKNLTEQQIKIHNIFSQHLEKNNVTDMGNHFELYENLQRNNALKDSLSHFSSICPLNEVKVYSCIDGAKSGWLRPHLFFINNDYIVSIGKHKKIEVYDNQMNPLLSYSINYDSFSISSLETYNDIIRLHEHISNTGNYVIDLDFAQTIYRSIDNENLFSFYESDGDEDKISINKLYFHKDTIELNSKKSFFSKLILDYDLKILEIELSNRIKKLLEIETLKKVNTIDEIFEKLKNNLEIYILKYDSPFDDKSEKEKLNHVINKIKNILSLKEEIIELFKGLEFLNKKYIMSIDNKYLKNYLFQHLNIHSKTNIEELDTELRENIEYFLNNDKTPKNKEFVENYYSLMHSLKLLKSENENLMDIDLIKNVINTEQKIKKIVQKYNKLNSIKKTFDFL